MTDVVEQLKTDREAAMERIHQKRLEMGTASKTVDETTEAYTEFIRGGEKIEVDLISGPRNPYRDMFIFATQTWGGPDDGGEKKWRAAKVPARMDVVRAVLLRKALPLALELPTFLFEIRNTGRIAFDQYARARVGVTFSSQGTRDNAHPDIAVIVPPRIYDDPIARAAFEHEASRAKVAYVSQLKAGQASWQDARYLLPQGIVHRFAMSINYMSLSNLMGKRLQFCEEHVTVATAWKLRKAVWDAGYSLLAVPLRPSCDFARRCTYRDHDQVGENFSNLFSGCGRWPDPLPVGEFNYAAADTKDVFEWTFGKGASLKNYEEVLALYPKGEDPVPWESAFERDRHFFEED